jgi:hypothetical protein
MPRKMVNGIGDFSGGERTTGVVTEHFGELRELDYDPIDALLLEAEELDLKDLKCSSRYGDGLRIPIEGAL